MAVDEEGKVIGRPEDFYEFKLKYGDKLIALFKDKEMAEDFIYLLDEYANFSLERFEIQKLLERMFHFMLTYQYQPESQSPTHVKCMIYAADQLRLWKDTVDSLWDFDINKDVLDSCYLNAREYLLMQVIKPKCIELDEIIPKTNPYNYIADDYTKYETVKEFCRNNLNNNLPEMVEYVKNYFWR